MAANPCAILDAVSAAQLEVMRRLNKKFEALRRLADLLSQLGDLANWIPNISKLVPVIDIDLSAYQNLVASCPYLNLPYVSDGQVKGLRDMVIGAYSQLARQVLNSPWNRAAALQEQMDGYLAEAQQKLWGAGAQAGQFIQCMQAMCNAATAAADTANNFYQNAGDAGEVVSNFATNFVQNGGQVLSDTTRQQAATARSTVSTLRDLGADIRQDYRDASGS
jgi:hypothetical protein